MERILDNFKTLRLARGPKLKFGRVVQILRAVSGSRLNKRRIKVGRRFSRSSWEEDILGLAWFKKLWNLIGGNGNLGKGMRSN